MKIKKILTFDEVINSVMNEITGFLPLIENIRRGIEWVIYNDYVKRDENDHSRLTDIPYTFFVILSYYSFISLLFLWNILSLLLLSIYFCFYYCFLKIVFYCWFFLNIF